MNICTKCKKENDRKLKKYTYCLACEIKELLRIGNLIAKEFFMFNVTRYRKKNVEDRRSKF